VDTENANISVEVWIATGRPTAKTVRRARSENTSRDAARQRGADDAQLGEAQVAEDERVVRAGIDHVGDQHDHQRRPHDLAPLQVAAQTAVDEKGRQPRDQRLRIGLRQRHERELLAREGQEAPRPQPRHSHRYREHEREHTAPLERAPRLLTLAGAVRLRDHGIEAQQDATRKEHRRERPDVRGRRRRHGVRVVAAEHHGIDEAQQHHAELRPRHRHREPKQSACLIAGRARNEGMAGGGHGAGR
jgi:hypothetical protein